MAERSLNNRWSKLLGRRGGKRRRDVCKSVDKRGIDLALCDVNAFSYRAGQRRHSIFEVSFYNATVVDIEVTNLNGKYCRLQVCFV